MSDRASFDAFLKSYAAAAVKGDKAYLRKTLPPTIADDHLDFLLETNKAMFGQIEAAGITPEVSEKPGCMEACYTLRHDDGVEKLTRPFWWHEGKWVSYDPANPEG